MADGARGPSEERRPALRPGARCSELRGRRILDARAAAGAENTDNARLLGGRRIRSREATFGIPLHAEGALSRRRRANGWAAARRSDAKRGATASPHL